MAISSLHRCVSSAIRLNSPAFSITARLTLSSVAEKYYAHLLNHPQNPEKTLVQIRDELDKSSVIEVLNRFSHTKPELGLRFFIWAGLQSKYRHTPYMYSLACNVLQIRRNPSRIREVLEAYKVEGCVTNVRLFKVVMNLCKEARIYDETLWVLRRMQEFNCRPDTTIYNVVIGLACQKGDLNLSIGLMKEMEGSNLIPDVITYMSMLKGFCNADRLEDACLLFKAMKHHGCAANLVAYSTLLDGLCRFCHFERAFELLREMEKEGGECTPNVITYTSVIQSLCKNGRSTEALSILDRMAYSKCAPNRITIDVLVKGLCAERCINEAYKLVSRVSAEGHVTSGECYSSLVMGLLDINRPEDAEKLFRWMLTNGSKPTGLACSSLINNLCAKGTFLNAFCVLENVEKMGFVLTIDSDIYSVLLVGLCRQQNVVEVAKLSSLMVEKRIQMKAFYIKDIQKHFQRTRQMESLAQLCKMEGEC